MAGPAATKRIAQVAAQRTSMVRAPPSVATCAVRYVAAGPAIAHGEGHIVFATS